MITGLTIGLLYHSTRVSDSLLLLTPSQEATVHMPTVSKAHLRELPTMWPWSILHRSISRVQAQQLLLQLVLQTLQQLTLTIVKGRTVRILEEKRRPYNSIISELSQITQVALIIARHSFSMLTLRVRYQTGISKSSLNQRTITRIHICCQTTL